MFGVGSSLPDTGNKQRDPNLDVLQIEMVIVVFT